MLSIQNVLNSSCLLVHVLTGGVEQGFALNLTDGHIHYIGILRLHVLLSCVEKDKPLKLTEGHIH